MNKNIDKLAAIFTEDFISKNSDLDNLDAIYAAVLKVDSTIPREDFDVFIAAVSEGMKIEGDELSESSLENVAGGIAWATVAAVCGLLTFCYKGGQAIGTAIGNARR